jgi:hypothetical protein
MLLRAAVLMPTIVLTIAVAVALDVETPNSSNAPIRVAAESGSDAPRSACTPDVLRLCGRFILDVNRIVACLKLQRPNLSPGCPLCSADPSIRGASLT